MDENQETSSTLLGSIRSGVDQNAWEQFVALYEPLVTRWLRQSGIPLADTPDVGQIVLMSLHSSMQRFEYERGCGGGFRGYLRRVVGSKIADYWKARSRRPPHVSLMEAVDSPSPDSFADEWDQEYIRHVLAQCLGSVRPTVDSQTWEIFILSSHHGKSAKEIGANFGISEQAVYSRVGRVMEKLRESVKQIDADIWPEV